MGKRLKTEKTTRQKIHSNISDDCVYGFRPFLPPIQLGWRYFFFFPEPVAKYLNYDVELTRSDNGALTDSCFNKQEFSSEKRQQKKEREGEDLCLLDLFYLDAICKLFFFLLLFFSEVRRKKGNLKDEKKKKKRNGESFYTWTMSPAELSRRYFLLRLVPPKDRPYIRTIVKMIGVRNSPLLSSQLFLTSPRAIR